MRPLTGYVGLTDFNWYTFLSAQPALDEINFWQPSGGRAFRVLHPGEPFFFRLRSPYKAIAGFGWFARHSVSSISYAWDAFGPKNGAPDYSAFRRYVEGNRDGGARQGDNFRIGCVMIAQPVFFPPEQWIEQPADWKQGIQQGKSYDVTTGEGARLLQSCMARTGARPLLTNVPAAEDLPVGAELLERYGTPQLVRPRLGQGIFRMAVKDAYQGSCAITNEHSLPVLEAAHIKPYAGDGTHEVHNGILLRTDIHRLFDKGYVTITPEHRFLVSPRLREDWENGKTYYAMQDKVLRAPQNPKEHPSREALSWHNENVFLG